MCGNMVFKKQAKKGQAAIEFLMTYGWMLLVVLIVGALIFSFVDFGSLIPNQVNLNNNLQADATRSLASNTDTGTGLVQIVFQYNGARKATVNSTDSYIETILDERCQADPATSNQEVRNTDTGSAGATATFLNGQTGVLTFDCRGSSPTVQLIEGDNIEGEISIAVQDPQTGIAVPSRGDMRLTIS